MKAISLTNPNNNIPNTIGKLLGDQACVLALI